MAVDISVLEGWLIKDKSKTPKYSFLGESNKRWFKVQLVRGLEGEELALCYFKDNKSDEPKGWVFAKDVTEIKEDKVSFTIISPSRTFKLRAQTRAEHKLWTTGIRAICPDALFDSEGGGGGGGGGELNTPRAEVKGVESRVVVTPPTAAQDKNTSLKRTKPKAPLEEQEPADAKDQTPPPRSARDSERGSRGDPSRHRVDTPYENDLDYRGQQPRSHPRDDVREVMSDRRRSRGQGDYYDRDSRDRRRGEYDDEDDYYRRGGRGNHRGGRDGYRDDYDEDDDYYRQRRDDGRRRGSGGGRGRRSNDGREEDEDEEYQRWKEERRQHMQQQQQSNTPGGGRRGSGNNGPAKQVVVPPPQSTTPPQSSQQSTTSRVHQHIRSGSNGHVQAPSSPSQQDVPSSPLASEAPNSRPTPKPAHPAPKAFLLPAQQQPDSEDEEEGGPEEEPPRAPAPSPDAPGAAAKVKRTAADEFQDEDGGGSKGVGGGEESKDKWDRFVGQGQQAADRPLDSDSDEEKVDFAAEKSKLQPSRKTPSPQPPPSSSSDQQDGGAKDGDGPPSFELPGEKPLPSSTSSSLRASDDGTDQPPSTRSAKGRIPAPTGAPPPTRAMPKTARPKSMRAPAGPPPDNLAAAKPTTGPSAAVVKADANFAEEDWDAPSSSTTEPPQQAEAEEKGVGKVVKRMSKKAEEQAGGRGRRPAPAGVKEDENWLDEDFDS